MENLENQGIISEEKPVFEDEMNPLPEPSVEEKKTSKKQKKKVQKKNNGTMKIVLMVLVAALIAGGAYFYKSFSGADLKQNVFIEELGAQMTNDPYYYLEGNSTIISKSKIDISMVDRNQVGMYDATATIGFMKKEFHIKIEDTLPPEIIVESPITVEIGEPVSTDEFVLEVKDASPITVFTVSDYIVRTEGQIDPDNNVLPVYTLKFEEEGEHQVVLVATDVFENTSEQIVIVNVEDSRNHYSGIKDLTIEEGTERDWLKDVEYDEKVKRITVDSTDVEISKEGSYDLIYYIEMASGVEIEEKVTVKVTKKKTVTQPTQKEEVSQEEQVQTGPYVGNSGHTFNSYESAEEYALYKMEVAGVKDYSIVTDGYGGYTVDFTY